MKKHPVFLVLLLATAIAGRSQTTTLYTECSTAISNAIALTVTTGSLFTVSTDCNAVVNIASNDTNITEIVIGSGLTVTTVNIGYLEFAGGTITTHSTNNLVIINTIPSGYTRNSQSVASNRLTNANVSTIIDASIATIAMQTARSGK